MADINGSAPAEVDSALKWNEDKYMIKKKEKGEKQLMLALPCLPSRVLRRQLSAVGWSGADPVPHLACRGTGF